MTRFAVTGTDTDVGKTVFAAGLAGYLGAAYWKPVQAGLADETDSQTVARLTTGRCTILSEAWTLATPCSPDEAARIEGVVIDPDQLSLPALSGPLVVEGAGGALVPLNDSLVFVDIFARWNLPVIIVARTSLGTINHSLLTIEALRARGAPIHGIVFSGDANPASERSIITHGNVAHLGRLPRIDPLDAENLRSAFITHVAVDLL